MESVIRVDTLDGLQCGEESPRVLLLQCELNNTGYGPLLLDGCFGAATKRVVMDAQKGMKQQVSGIATPRLLRVLGLEDGPDARARRVTLSVWERFKDTLLEESAIADLPPLVVLAALAAESGWMGTWRVGMPTIRFSAHRFRLHVPSNIFDKVLRISPERGSEVRDAQSGTWHGIHTGRQEAEYFALSAASVYDLHAAYGCISLGAPQLPGRDFDRVGYETALDMFVGFGDERNQIRGLLQHLELDAGIALRNLEWARYAKWRVGTDLVDFYAGYLSELHCAAGKVIREP